jgi:hypothetical protein
MYSHYQAFPKEVAISEPSDGEDPRRNRRNSLNEVDVEYLRSLFQALGIEPQLDVPGLTTAP